MMFPVIVCDPDHTSVPVIVPLDVSLVAMAVGISPTRPIMTLVSIKNDKNRLLFRWVSFMGVTPSCRSGTVARLSLIHI